jgi:hypothetical protein
MIANREGPQARIYSEALASPNTATLLEVLVATKITPFDGLDPARA